MTNFAVPTIFSVVDKITPAVGQMKGGVNKFKVDTNAAFRSIIPPTSGFGKMLSSVAGQVAIGTLAVKGLSKAYQMLKSTIASIPEYAARADEIGKSSQKLGLSTDALQRYRYAASIANVESGTLTTAFQTMTKQIGNGALYTSLDKIDKGLSAQVKSARTVDEAFRTITTAMKNEGDAGKRTAVLMSAFGKSGNALVPMLGDLEEQMAAASKYGNIIPPSAIETAIKFDDTITRTKAMIQSFGDVIRSAVVTHVLPLITSLQEWAATNRELIATKIQGFVAGLFKIIRLLRTPIDWIVKHISLIGPAVLLVAVAFKTWKTTTAIVKGVTIAMAAYELAQKKAAIAAGINTAATAASGVAATGATGAFAALNAVIAANPIGFVITLVVTGITLLITLIGKLSEKVGGLGNALKVIGFTALAVGKAIIKTLISPLVLAINFVMDVVQGLISVIGLIPGIGEKMASVNSAIEGYQDKFKDVFELRTDDFTSIGNPYRDARAAELAREETAAEAVGEKPTLELDPELKDILGKLLEGQEDEVGAINGLKGAGKGSARALNFAGAGAEDFFETQRYGM
ncbi:hypothetical protein LQZ19_08730 [Treponema primitia]|uniref:hypothetical protein n=1 Tax=Treponema primitia TaxID=88058 RepID=UPI00397F1B09